MTLLRSYALTLCLLFNMSLINNVFGQLLQEGFETHSCTSSACGVSIDNTGCLSNWQPWFGTPSIRSNIATPNGLNYLYLGYSNGILGPLIEESEGVIASLSQQGNIGDQLDLSFIARREIVFSSTSNFILKVFIASGVQGNWSLPGSCYFPMPPISGLQIQEIATFPVMDFSTTQWGSINITNKCAQIPYDQLIFAIDFNGQPLRSTGGLLIDDVLLTRQAVIAPDPPSVEVINSTPNLCGEGNSISVTYEICAEQDITVDIDASANQSVTAQPAAQIINFAAGTCEEVTIVYTEANDLVVVA